MIYPLPLAYYLYSYENDKPSLILCDIPHGQGTQPEILTDDNSLQSRFKIQNSLFDKAYPCS